MNPIFLCIMLRAINQINYLKTTWLSLMGISQTINFGLSYFYSCLIAIKNS